MGLPDAYIIRATGYAVDHNLCAPLSGAFIILAIFGAWLSMKLFLRYSRVRRI